MPEWSPDVICWVELEDGLPTNPSLEVLQEGSSLARQWGGQLVALVLNGTPDVMEPAQWDKMLGPYGAQAVLLAAHPLLENYSSEVYCLVLNQLLTREKWGVFLVPASPNGSDFAAVVASQLKINLVSDCIRVTAGGSDRIRMTRPIYADRLHSVYEAQATPVMITFRPGARGVAAPGPVRPVELRPVPVQIEPSQVRIRSLGIVQPDPATVDLREAERIVSVGLGLPYPAGLELAQQIATQLGAAVGATRPVVDKGWLPFDRQIGTTGRSVAPRLYFALGISGAGQHTGGITGAKTIVTINPDRSAPMMALSDLAVVGDASVIVPLLLKKLAARRKTATREQNLIGQA